MEGLPGWGISSMPGPSPRQHKHERRYIPGTHSFIPTRRIWNDDYCGQMIFGDLGGLKFSHICLTGEEKPEKTSPRKLVPTGDRTRARCVTGAHATASSTAVEKFLLIFLSLCFGLCLHNEMCNNLVYWFWFKMSIIVEIIFFFFLL